jgi:hypothetical protein
MLCCEFLVCTYHMLEKAFRVLLYSSRGDRNASVDRTSLGDACILNALLRL